MKVFPEPYFVGRDVNKMNDVVMQLEWPQMMGRIFFTGTPEGEAKFLARVNNPAIRHKVPGYAIYVVYAYTAGPIDVHPTAERIQEVLADMGAYYVYSFMTSKRRKDYARPTPMIEE